MKFPSRAFAKFQSIHRKIKAIRDVNERYELQSLKIFGKYAKIASTNMEQYLENEEGDEDHEEDIDVQEQEESDKTLHFLYS